MIIEQTKLTADEFFRLPDASGLELVHGRVLEKKMGARSSYIGGRLFGRLAAHCDSTKVGLAFPADTAYQCFPDDPNHIRKPDVSFILAGRLPDGAVPEGYMRIAPDSVTEVVSPNDLHYEVDEKIEDYFAVQVRLIWVVLPAIRKVRIHRLNGPIDEVGLNGELDGEDVIPGFRCRVAELFAVSVGANGIA